MCQRRTLALADGRGAVFALTSTFDVQRAGNDRLGAFDLVGERIVAFSEYRQGH